MSTPAATPRQSRSRAHRVASSWWFLFLCLAVLSYEVLAVTTDPKWHARNKYGPERSATYWSAIITVLNNKLIIRDEQEVTHHDMTIRGPGHGGYLTKLAIRGPVRLGYWRVAGVQYRDYEERFAPNFPAGRQQEARDAFERWVNKQNADFAQYPFRFGDTSPHIIWSGHIHNLLTVGSLIGVVFAARLLFQRYYRPRRERLLARGLCPKCTYSIRGIVAADDSVTCPECGSSWAVSLTLGVPAAPAPAIAPPAP